MHSQVQGDGNPGDSSQTDQLGVAQQGGSAMVVGVEEGQWLLLEEQEDRVKQFQILGQVRELHDVSFPNSSLCNGRISQQSVLT